MYVALQTSKIFVANLFRPLCRRVEKEKSIDLRPVLATFCWNACKQQSSKKVGSFDTACRFVEEFIAERTF